MLPFKCWWASYNQLKALIKRKDLVLLKKKEFCLKPVFGRPRTATLTPLALPNSITVAQKEPCIQMGVFVCQ